MRLAKLTEREHQRVSASFGLARPGAELDVERAAALLATCKDVGQVKDVRDRAAAIGVWLRSQRASLQAQNDAAEIMIRSARRGGELVREMPKHPGARGVPQKGKTRGGKLPPRVDAPPTLDELGIDKTTAKRWQQVARVPEPVFELYVSSVRARAEKLTTSGAIAATSAVEGYDSNEYYTPEPYVDAARLVLRTIDLDPASCEFAQRRIGAGRYFSKLDDGLSKTWDGRVWLNPPFSAPLGGRFVEKLCEEYSARRVVAAVLLQNASTDAAWFHRVARLGTTCFVEGRINFDQATGKTANNRFAQAFHCLGDAKVTERFVATFTQFGSVGQLRGGPHGD